jgi:hypothetical protein
VREGFWIATFVTLIPLLGVDIGLHAALWFGTPTPPGVITTQPPMDSKGSHETQPVKEDSPFISYAPLIIGVLDFVRYRLSNGHFSSPTQDYDPPSRNR